MPMEDERSYTVWEFTMPMEEEGSCSNYLKGDVGGGEEEIHNLRYGQVLSKLDWVKSNPYYEYQTMPGKAFVFQSQTSFMNCFALVADCSRQ